MAEKACRTCIYFYQLTENVGKNCGQCRRYPPTLEVEIDFEKLITCCTFKTVSDMCYCGEYKSA